MTFGKHKGEEIKDIPEQYLRWFLTNCGDADPGLFRAVRDHLGMTKLPGDGTDAVYGAALHYTMKTALGLTIWRDKTRAHLLTFFQDDTDALALLENIHNCLLARVLEVQRTAESYRLAVIERERLAAIASPPTA